MAKVKQITALEARRRMMNMSQEEVARKAEIPYATYRYMEKKGRLKSVDTADKVSKVLNSTINELFLPQDM